MSYAISCNMVVREEKVLLSEDRLGRVAIVERSDGLFCLYAHWRWDVETQQALQVEPVQDLSWTTDFNSELYYDTVSRLETRPEPGIYGSLENAEKEARSMLGIDRF